ncbi:MAG TPA: hypothetical protein VGE45_02330 [Chloroflexia bacterium]
MSAQNTVSKTKAQLDISISNTPKEDNILQALLNEFNMLHNEVAYRSDYQSRFLQFHITTLTLILGAAISTLASAESDFNAVQIFSPWVLLIIPIESCIFGLWYLDHALVIAEIGYYIQTRIETRIRVLVDDPSIFWWEEYIRTGGTIAGQRRSVRVRRPLSLTFAGPALVSMLTTLVFLLLSLPVVREYLGLTSIPAIYNDLSLWLAVPLWITDLFVFRAYLSSDLHTRKISRERNAQIDKTPIPTY